MLIVFEEDDLWWSPNLCQVKPMILNFQGWLTTEKDEVENDNSNLASNFPEIVKVYPTLIIHTWNNGVEMILLPIWDKCVK